MATQAQIIAAVVQSMPYPSQIAAFDLSEGGVVRFEWVGQRFRVSASGHVEEARNGVLVGSAVAILAQALIEPAIAKVEGRDA